MSLFSLIVLALAVLLAGTFFFVVKWRQTFWIRKKVQHAQPTFLIGNYGSYILLKKHITETVNDLCEKFPNEPYFGAYYGTEPTLIVKHPDLLKLILTKDFYYFNGREVSSYAEKEVFTKSLFFNYGDSWKVLRQNLTPLFSSSKMKNMFVLIEKCSKTLEQLLEQKYETSNVINVRDIMVMFTMDCVGTSTFGVETNVMREDPRNPFKSIGFEIFENSNIRGLKTVLRAVWPSIFYGLGFKVFPKSLEVFFSNLILTVAKQRSKSRQEFQNFVDLLFNFKEKHYVTGDSLNNFINSECKTVKIEATSDMFIGQCIGFFGAGYETSSTTLTHTLFELAKNPECQEKAIIEVDKYLEKHSNKLVYDCVTELPYLKACINETLRLYPVVGLLTREVMSNYKFPNGLVLPKGMRVHIPVYHLHRHPDYWSKPLKYRPERFLPDETHNIHPYTFMPFGEGPRICIGMRFAIMQMLPGLITVLKRYRMQLAVGMHHTLENEPRALVTQTKGEVRLEFVKRTDTLNSNFV